MGTIKKVLIERKKLLNDMYSNRTVPLKILLAPMGYGKTTFVQQYLETFTVDYLWLAFVSKLNSSELVWDKIVTEVTRYDESFGESLRVVGLPSDGFSRNRLILEMERYLKGNRLTLVIDDFHNIESHSALQLLEDIVRSNVKCFDVIVITRSMPDISVDDLKIKDLVKVYSKEDFKVNKNQIKEYFIANKSEITVSQVNEIYTLSEGWITGVHLLLLSYIENQVIQYDKHIDDLVRQTLLSNFSEWEIKILAYLSMVDCFNIKQALFILDQKIKHEELVNLLGRVGFVFFNRKTETYQLHHIIKQYLIKICNTCVKSDEKQAFLIRLAIWYMEHNELVSGLDCFIKAEDYDAIMKAFERKSIVPVLDNHKNFVMSLFEQIPEDLLWAYPLGYLAYIGFIATNVDMIEGAKMFAMFERHFLHDMPEDGDKIFGEIEMVKSTLMFNDIELMSACHKRAYELLKGPSSVATKEKIASCGSIQLLYLYFKKSGTVRETAMFIDENYHYYQTLTQGCGAGFEKEVIAEYFYETGSFEDAILYAKEAIYTATQFKQEDILLCAQLTVARSLIALGRKEDLVTILEQIKENSKKCLVPIIHSSYELVLAYLATLVQDESLIASWMLKVDVEKSQVLYHAMGYNFIVMARVALMKKDYYRMINLCNDLEKSLNYFSNILGYLHLHILRAIALYNLKGFKAAVEDMEKAFKLAERDSLKGLFFEYAIQLKFLLEEYKSYKLSKDFVMSIREESHIHISRTKTIQNELSNIVELTDREQRIIKLVANGGSNKSVAKELNVSEITVKKHLTSIYKKLAVNGRVHAINKSREIGLLTE